MLMQRRKRETSLIALVEQSRQSYLLFGSRKVFSHKPLPYEKENVNKKVTDVIFEFQNES